MPAPAEDHPAESPHSNRCSPLEQRLLSPGVWPALARPPPRLRHRCAPGQGPMKGRAASASQAGIAEPAAAQPGGMMSSR